MTFTVALKLLALGALALALSPLALVAAAFLPFIPVDALASAEEA